MCLCFPHHPRSSSMKQKRKRKTKGSWRELLEQETPEDKQDTIRSRQLMQDLDVNQIRKEQRCDL